MRDLYKLFIVGMVFCTTALGCVAETYRVAIIPDNIVTDTAAVDSFIFNAASDFFAGEIINILNSTEFIKAPTVSEQRAVLKKNTRSMTSAKTVTEKFRNTYTIDFAGVKKIANSAKSKYALLLTTAVDAENYVLRRTLWDFLNIAGAAVIDPAYKLNTYAALIDTEKNLVLWSNTYYKTISVCENRIITRGFSPQTEQLEKIRDYSRMLCPEIAQHVQVSILPPDVYEKESNQIYYDMANFDNIFTKKYRRWHKEGSKDYNALKSNTGKKVNNTKEKVREWNKKQKGDCPKCRVVEPELDVKAEPYYNQTKTENNIQNIKLQKTKLDNFESAYEPVDIKKTHKNTLFGDIDPYRPKLREYYK